MQIITMQSLGRTDLLDGAVLANFSFLFKEYTDNSLLGV